jgi:N6-adenosine-specific RNA methylase IME4
VKSTSVFKRLRRRHFACVLADPPWRFRVWSRKTGLGRSADQHYPTLTLEDIKAFPIKDLCAPDAWLFLWITGPFLAIGEHVAVMKAWGFKPSGIMFAWAKRTKRDTGWHFGNGYTSRHNVELCLVGRRGSPIRMDKGVPELIVAPVREHSRKPDEAQQRIERFCPGPRLELFGRRRRSGWTVFGNQIGKEKRRPRRTASKRRKTRPIARSRRSSRRETKPRAVSKT